MMKKLNCLFLGLLIALFSGCTKDLEKEVVDNYADGTPKTVRYFRQEGKIRVLAVEEY